MPYIFEQSILVFLFVKSLCGSNSFPHRPSLFPFSGSMYVPSFFYQGLRRLLL